MSLASNVSNLEDQILRQFPLDRQVILLRILRADFRRGLSVQENWTEHRPIHCLISCRIQDAVKRIRRARSVLILERQVEHRVVNAGTAAERWLSTELLHHQLLDRIVENTESRANTRLSGPAEQLSQESVFRTRTPRQADARRKRFVVSVCQTNRHSLIARYHQSCWHHTR